MNESVLIKKAIKSAIKFKDESLADYLRSYFELEKKPLPANLAKLATVNLKFETKFEGNTLNKLKGKKLLLAKIKRSVNQNEQLIKEEKVLIEIILPVFNGEIFLKRLLPSLKKQRYDGPIIISAADNRSLDDSVKILTDYQIPIVNAFAYQRIGYAQVEAIKQAEQFFPFVTSHKRIFLFLDQDTYLVENDYLAKLAKTFEEDEEKMVSVRKSQRRLRKKIESFTYLFFYLIGFGPKGIVRRIGNFGAFFSTYNLAIRGTLLETLKLKDYLSQVMVDDVFISFVLNDWLPKSQIAFNSWQKVVHDPYPQNRALLYLKWIRKYWFEFFVTKWIYQEWRRDFFGEQKLSQSLFSRLIKLPQRKLESILSTMHFPRLPRPALVQRISNSWKIIPEVRGLVHRKLLKKLKRIIS